MYRPAVTVIWEQVTSELILKHCHLLIKTIHSKNKRMAGIQRCSLDPSGKNARLFEKKLSCPGGCSLARPPPEAWPPPPGHAGLGMRALGQAPVIAKSNRGRVDIIRHCYFEHAIILHYGRFHSLVSRSSPIINVLPAVFRHLTNISLAVDGILPRLS